jgi:6-phosphofructokinase 1
VTVLGHVVRGGRPSVFDRPLGSRRASVAIRALLGGAHHRRAAWMPVAELAPDVATRSPVDPCCWRVDLGAVLAETENLLRGRGPPARRRVRGDRGRAAAFAQVAVRRAPARGGCRI